MASRRGYLSQTELSIFADINISDSTEADDRISQAEELIDGFVGVQPRFLNPKFPDFYGKVAAVIGNNQFQLESRHQNIYLVNYFTYTEVEIVGGTGAGQRHIIQSSTYPGFLTLVDSFNPSIDLTSYYRIYQLGKFPRIKDVYLDAINPSIPTYVKNIPEAVKRATAAQVAFMIEQGDDFFQSDDVYKNNERMGDYSYTKARDGSGTGIEQLIAPKAKMLLLGIINRKGVLLAP